MFSCVPRKVSPLRLSLHSPFDHAPTSGSQLTSPRSTSDHVPQWSLWARRFPTQETCPVSKEPARPSEGGVRVNGPGATGRWRRPRRERGEQGQHEWCGIGTSNTLSLSSTLISLSPKTSMWPNQLNVTFATAQVELLEAAVEYIQQLQQGMRQAQTEG